MAEKSMVNGKLSIHNKSKTNYFLAVTVIVLLIVLTAGAGFVYFHVIRKLENRICRSEGCWRINADLVSSIDSTSDPCDNFTRYICDRREDGTFGRRVMQMRAKQFLTQSSVERWGPLEIARKFYASCRDTDSMDQLGNDEIWSIIEELNVWPASKPDKKTFSFNLTNFLCRSLEMNIQFEWLFRISVKMENTMRDEIETLVEVASPEKLNYFKDGMKRITYVDLIYTTLLDLCKCRFITRTDARDVAYFEMELKKLWRSFDSLNTRTISSRKLSDIFPHVDVFALTKWLPEKFSKFWIAVDVGAMEELDLLLNKTTKWTLANYLVWKVVEHYGFYVGNVLRGRFEDFYRFDSREDLCLNEVDNRFPMVLEIFYKKFYLKPHKNFPGINEMTSAIETSILSKIENARWIDRRTKGAIVKKLNGMRRTLVVMDNMDDVLSEALELSIDELGGNSSSIFDTIDAQRRFLLRTRQVFMNLTLMDPLEVFGRSLPKLVDYNDGNNELVFSYMTLDDYFFSTEQPSYINYGLIGSTIAREMSKSIQISNDSKSHVWGSTNGTDLEIFAKTVCLGDLYEDPDGFQARFEDVVGVGFAYEAYVEQEWDAENRRLFWEFYGLQACREADGWPRLDMLKHSEYFGWDYGCGVGTNMNPSKKCRVF